MRITIALQAEDSLYNDISSVDRQSIAEKLLSVANNLPSLNTDIRAFWPAPFSAGVGTYSLTIEVTFPHQGLYERYAAKLTQALVRALREMTILGLGEYEIVTQWHEQTATPFHIVWVGETHSELA